MHLFSILEQAIVGYLHNLSPIKTSKSYNQYFDLEIQTSNQVYRTVCFSPDKHSLLKRKLQSSSPIKIHKYQLKKNERSGENDLILNKRTKIEDPDDSETDFDYVPVKTEATQAIDATTEEIHNGDAHTLINKHYGTPHLQWFQGNPSGEGKKFDETRSNLHRQHRVNPCCVVGKRYPKGDYWHLLQHQRHCCRGIWRNKVSDTHKAQHN